MTALSGQELELSDYLPHLVEAADLRPGDSVVDVGCGTGGPTVAAAARANPGPVVGVDLWESSVVTARARVPRGLTNLSYVVADAQTHRPATAPVDVVISRFGLMFFDDPAAAFANVASWLRPAGRLAALVWQPQALNPWILETNRALTGDPVGIGLTDGSPFSLGDRELLSGMLDRAGFTDVAITAVHEPVHFGATVADAEDFVLSFGSAQDALARLTPRGAEQARRSLTRLLSRHVQADGMVSLPSAAWLVRART